MIRIVTDSNAQLPPDLRERYDVTVVPIIVNVNGTEYHEGVDLDADAFYRFWEHGQPEIATSQPSPGDFATIYERLAHEGASAILSIHVGSDYSGTLNSAALAASRAPVPVRLVDSMSLSFGISCCVWEAAEALRSGADIDDAATRAEATSARVSSVTVLQALEFTRSRGRLVDVIPDEVDGIPVFAISGGDTTVIGEGRSIDVLSRLMADAMTAGGDPIRVAVGIADASAEPLSAAMEQLLAARSDVVDLIRYRVGPSVGAFTGPGTAGGFWYPL